MDTNNPSTVSDPETRRKTSRSSSQKKGWTNKQRLFRYTWKRNRFDKLDNVKELVETLDDGLIKITSVAEVFRNKVTYWQESALNKGCFTELIWTEHNTDEQIISFLKHVGFFVKKEDYTRIIHLQKKHNKL